MRNYKKLRLLKKKKKGKMEGITQYIDEFGVKYFDLKEICIKHLNMTLAEILYFKKKLSYIEEFSDAFAFGDYEGAGVHIIKSTETPAFIKRLQESDLFSHSLRERMNSLLETKDSSLKNQENLMDSLINLEENEGVYLRDFKPRVSVAKLSTLYGFSTDYLSSICKEVILKSEFSKMEYYSEKHNDLTFEGFFLLQTVCLFQNEKYIEIVRSLSNLNNLVMSKVCNRILING